MGSAALYHLAKRGLPVLGIDALAPPHKIGSTHGETRITRQAIGEGEHYTPLALRSYELFREVEQTAQTHLLQITGGLMIGNQTKASVLHVPDFFPRTLNAATRYQIKHDLLDARALRQRFPQFNVDDDEVGYYEYEAGILLPELCVSMHLHLAAQAGADVHVNEALLSFDERPGDVLVRTDAGAYNCETLILTVGPWIAELLPELKRVFKVYRQVLFWFDVSNAYAQFVPPHFPIFIWQIKSAEHGIYGFPAVDGPDGGMKIAGGRYEELVTPDTVQRAVAPEEAEQMYDEVVSRYFPQVGRRCIKSAVCLYTVTDDAGFVIDRLPGTQRVLLCSACSGHGFKHSAAIGEHLAELATGSDITVDLSACRLDRFLSPRI